MTIEFEFLAPMPLSLYGQPTIDKLDNHYWWLSFADPEREEGTQFLGVCIVPAPTFGLAVIIAGVNGCNPGGECQGIEIPDKMSIDPKWVGRLLSRKDCELFDQETANPSLPPSQTSP